MKTAPWLLVLSVLVVHATSARASDPPPAPAPLAACAIESAAGAALGIYRTDVVPPAEAALTFDDGPLATATPRVLDMLAAHHARAAFFVVGRNITRGTYASLQRMVAEGHTIGSHCYTHDVHMTDVRSPERTVATIRAQHETTAVLVDLALLARSGDDFDALYRRVIGAEPGAWLSAAQLRDGMDALRVRHRALLTEHGFAGGQRPYHVVYARPPGGGPYQERDASAGIALYDAALRELGMISVLWHGGAGETDPVHGHDVRRLSGNIVLHGRRGGVLLIHDIIVPEALEAGLTRMAAEGVRLTSVDAFVARKYGCAPAAPAGRAGRASPEL